MLVRTHHCSLKSLNYYMFWLRLQFSDLNTWHFQLHSPSGWAHAVSQLQACHAAQAQDTSLSLGHCPLFLSCHWFLTVYSVCACQYVQASPHWRESRHGPDRPVQSVYHPPHLQTDFFRSGQKSPEFLPVPRCHDYYGNLVHNR